MRLILGWKIDGNRISFDYKGTEIWFEMPEYVTELPTKQALHLCEWLMLSPFMDVPFEDDPIAPNPITDTKLTVLCFSAGVDSTAALQVLPGCLPVYVERAGIAKKTLLRQDAHIKFCDKINALRIRTNFEIMRTFHGSMVGYSTGRGMAVPQILLTSALGADCIAYGAVLDDNAFPKGHYRALTDAYHKRQKRFTDAGLYCVEPLFGCSEVVSTKIVDAGPYKDLARSCLRGKADTPCGKCYKCYRKTLIRGGRPTMNRETQKAIEKNPPKMAGPLIWAYQRSDMSIPELDYAKDMATSFLERHYEPLLDQLPRGVKMEVSEQLQFWGINAMGANDVHNMINADFRRPE